jgi:UDP-N-acetylmuramate--alanine ligase
MKHIVKHIHFVGIGGAGMSGIAEVLSISATGERLGPSRNATTGASSALGARIAIGHDAANIEGATRWSSTAVRRQPGSAGRAPRRIPIVPRAVMLAELAPVAGIAIAGTHGKTTTTSLSRACSPPAASIRPS